MKPTAPLARAGGGETRFGACLLAKGFSTQSARRLMLAVKAAYAKLHCAEHEKFWYLKAVLNAKTPP